MNYRVGCFLFLTAVIRGNSAILGNVVDSESGRGVPHAVIRLLVGAQSTAEVSTDLEGHFVLEDVPLGRYVAVASKVGYVPSSLTQGSQSVVLTGGRDVQLIFKLTRAAVITGTVLDASGRPARSARVATLLRKMERGAVRWVPGQPVATPDDRGVYRLFGLSPGQYVVGVFPIGTGSSRLDAGSTFAPEYYSDAVRPERAQWIRLQPGEMRASVNLVLRSSSRYVVDGAVAGAPTEWEVRRIAVALVPADGYAAALQTVTSDDKGHFRFDAVPEGSYFLVAAGPAKGRTEWGPTLGEGALHTRRRVEVKGQDLQDVTLVFDKAVVVEGHVTSDDEEADPRCYSGAVISPEPEDPVIPTLRSVTVASMNGDFTLKDIAPALYRVKVELKSGCFVKELRINGRTIDSREAALEGSSVLTVIVTMKAGSVAGTVPAGPGAAVGLAPESSAGGVWSDETVVARVDERGYYRFDEVPPGRYRLMALSSAISDLFQDPQFWIDHKDHTATITVQPSNDIEVNLEMITPNGTWK